jgi:sarcosine oxidase
MHSSSKFVVIGAGLSGAATAWQLAQRGHEVTLVERTTPANDTSSSHGSARIFRYAYPDALYTRLVVDSRRGWDELSALSGTELVSSVGAVDFGSARRPERLAQVLAQHDIDHELMSARDAKDRWPQMEFDTSVLWHPGAGVLDSESAVLAMVRLALTHGAQVLTDWPVERIERDGRYRVFSSAGDVIDADHVVLCAGAYLPDLLANIPLPAAFMAQLPTLQVRQEQAFHFPYRTDRSDSGTRSSWPTFIYKSDRIETYGLPGGRDADFKGQKIAEYNGGRVLPSGAAQTGVIDPANRRRVIEYVTRHMPGLVPEPYAETTCLFTNTPTEDFIIDRVDNLTVVSPCSGHGAKFAPLIGQMAADLALGTGEVPEQFRSASRAALA